MKIDLRLSQIRRGGTIDDFRLIGAWVGLSLALAGCPAGDGQTSAKSDESQTGAIPRQSPIHFTAVTADSGLNFSITCGALPASEILEVNGGGLGVIDFDNDGDWDLFVANGATLADPENGPGCKLFENVGDLWFRDVTKKAGIEVRRWATGVAIGDYDGDGFDDIFVCCYGPDILLRNNRDGSFTDQTSEAFGADRTQISNLKSQIPDWSTSAAFADLDNDGDLDLYVCRYLEFDVKNRPPRTRYKDVEVMAGPHGLTPQHDVLYENRGDGTFHDISESSGCRAVRPSFGLNLVILDFDGDGWQDIVVANDSMPDFYFRNKGLRTESSPPSPPSAFPSPQFGEIGIISGIASNSDGSNQASMGIAIGDVDGNGRPDKFTTVFSSDVNALHLNVDGRLFEDRAQSHGLAMISRPYLGWSAGLFDFDLDSDEDLFFVNGHVYPQATMITMDSEFEQTPLLFDRAGPRFKKVTAEVGGPWLQEPHRDRNAVFADFDDDGDIDIIIGELNGPIRVLRNEAIGRHKVENLGAKEQSSEEQPQSGSPSPNPQALTPNPCSWLIVELRDVRPGRKNHRGLGSRIEVSISDAISEKSNRQIRWLFTGGGFQSAGAPQAHFGLGQLPRESELAVTIQWPDGHIQRLDHVYTNQRLIVRRNE